MPRRPVRLALTALVLALATTGCGVTKYVDSSAGRQVVTPTLGWKSIDPVSISLPTGDAVTDASPAPDLTGPLLVNVWASTCVPCRTELPMLEKISTEGTLAVVGFTRDLSKDNAREALERAGVTYGNWMDTDARVALAMDGQIPINQIPSSLLIRDGKVVAVHIGEFKDRQDVLDALEKK